MYNIHFICNGMVLYTVYNCMVNIPYCTSFNICLLYSYKLALYIIVDGECQDLSNINLHSLYIPNWVNSWDTSYSVSVQLNWMPDDLYQQKIGSHQPIMNN